MSGIIITADLDSAEATARLQAMMDRMDNRQGFLKSVGERLQKSTSDNFRNERGPDGAAWTPLAPATLRARARKGISQIRILSERGDLSGSISSEATNDYVRIGSNVVYAAIHQFGGTITKEASTRYMAGRRFARRQDASGGADVAIKAHAITIPARPFLGVSDEDRLSILEMAEDWLSGPA